MDARRNQRVLITADTVGGVWTYAVELAGALDRLGVRVALATMGAPLHEHQRVQLAMLPGVTVYESTYKLEWMQDPWDDVERAGEWLLQLEHECQPDLVHLNQFAFGALPFAAPTLVVAHSCVLSWWQAVKGEPAQIGRASCRERV
jgi:glycogen(starch) synthase